MKPTPVHIMRFAPADYETDPFVMLMKKRGAFRVLAFYTSFLFRSHMEGGSLPADIDLLSACLALDNRTTRDGLATCKQHAKIQQAGDRLFHKRVADGVAKELEYREKQRSSGKEGGRPKKGSLFRHESPPSPTPVPTPAPAPEPFGNRRNELVDRTAQATEGSQLIRLISQQAKLDPTEVLSEAGKTAGIKVRVVRLDALFDDNLVRTVSALRSWWRRLERQAAESEMPWERAGREARSLQERRSSGDGGSTP